MSIIGQVFAFQKALKTAVLSLALVLTGCGSPKTTAAVQRDRDPTSEVWYATATQELTDLDRKAEQLYTSGKTDAASALIEHGEIVASRLLTVSRPTLAATEAASDLDQLYGRMLFGNRHYGWARLQFQKNLARWKRWRPESPDTVKRLHQAQAFIDDCDRKIESGL